MTDELRERLEGLKSTYMNATPGEWKTSWDDKEPGPAIIYTTAEDVEDRSVVDVFYYDGHKVGCYETDAALIVGLHAAFPALVSELERLEAEKQQIAAELRAVTTNPPCFECGAMTAKDAETRCIANGDNDSCHGCELWQD